MPASRRTFEAWASIPYAKRLGVPISVNAGEAGKTELRANEEQLPLSWYGMMPCTWPLSDAS